MSHAEDFIFLPLGGSGEIGMNLNLYGYQGKWIMVDCGISFEHTLGLEIIMPDPSFIEEYKEDLLGIILTHAHEDHIGALPHLWHRLKAPMYATPFTAHLIREKLKESGHIKQAPMFDVPLGGRITLGPFDIEFIGLTHSIPEPNALAIRTPKGLIVHTGDWKIDPDPLVGASTEIKKLKALGDEGVLALVCDSTNAMVKGRSGSEADVRKELVKLIKKQKGRRVTVACFASNVARLTSAAYAAQETDRKVVLFGRSLFRMEEAARKNGYLKDIEPFLHEKDMDLYDPEEILIISTGSQGEPRAALSRMAQGTHQRIKLGENDTVIFSSRVIPGNEAVIKELQERLLSKGVLIVQDHEEDIHVSGHPARDELKEMYAWIRPHILIPVHGEHRHMREQALLGKKCGIPKCVVPTNGSVIALDPVDAGILDHVPHGRWAVDGTTLVSRKELHLRDRGRLMETGVAVVSFTLSSQNMLKSPLHITLLGVVEPSLEEKVTAKLTTAITQALKNPSRSHTDIVEEIRILTRRVIFDIKGKKPHVIIHALKGSTHARA